MKCDELQQVENPIEWGLYYDKNEVDSAIDELKREHHRERHEYIDMVAQLKAEADKVGLKEHVKSLILDNYLKDKELRRQKYKRCLAMAQEWRNYAAFCGMQSSCHNHRGFGKTAEKYTWKECHAWKCVKRWLAIAEKFKEAK